MERAPGFEVVASVTNTQDALREIARTRPHVLLLDLTLRGADGKVLLRQLRASAIPIEAIAVTAARRAETVRDLVHLGVLDYLVKPFTPERLFQALAHVRRRLGAAPMLELSQLQVDELCATSYGHRWLPKGLSEGVLDQVRATLRSVDEPRSAAWVAQRVGMARVTVRRYLEYLVATQQANCRSEAPGPGRPQKLYWPTDS